MTQVRYIHGLPAEMTVAEIRQRSNQVPDKKFLDYAVHTEGEFNLLLVRDQIEMLSAFYPEKAKVFQKGIDLINDALYKGVHSHSGTFTGILPGELAPVAKAIRNGRMKADPAGLLLLLKDRTKVTQGIDPGIHGDLVPQDNYQGILDSYNYLLSHPGASFGGKTPQQLLDDYNLCGEQNIYKKQLNTYLEDSSHHILYSFITDPNKEPNTVSVKSYNHGLVLDALADTTGLSRESLKIWTRNGIMRSNAKKGNGPMAPEDAIDALRSKWRDHNGVLKTDGIGIFGIDDAIIIAVIVLVTAAIKAYSSWKDNQTAKMADKLRNAAPNIGLPSFGPDSQGNDYQGFYSSGGGNNPGGNNPGGNNPGGGGNNNNSSNNMLPILLAGGAALFLLND